MLVQNWIIKELKIFHKLHVELKTDICTYMNEWGIEMILRYHEINCIEYCKSHTLIGFNYSYTRHT